eukprot:scaffold17649_cov40-Cyclotella_meneghiniana.AAC.6
MGGGKISSSTQYPRYISHQDCVFSDWFKQMTASQPFQFLILSIMNGWRRLRLVCGLSNGVNTTCFSIMDEVKVDLPVFHF